MSRVFADSFYFFALTNRRDQRHIQARDWTEAYSGSYVTTEWVLLELADGLAESPARASFQGFRQAILANARNHVLELDMDLYRTGLELYNNRADKQWSLTDCISFVVMQREGLTEALTADRHFEQAGFRALFA